jgi:Fic family protein
MPCAPSCTVVPVSEDASASPTVIPYEPFPSFKDWASSYVSTGAFDSFAALLAETHAASAEESLQRAVDQATKWAAVDTGAIEGLYEVERGFTFSVATSAAAWDNMHQVVGMATQNAIHDALSGYEFVLDVATGGRPVTETWIKELHATLCASQKTYTVMTEVGPQEHELPKGEYKRFPNNPLKLATNEIFSYASVDDTAPEMARLVDELSSQLFANSHPVVQAAYAHYAFVRIHPFADGNGRVSRALASTYLYRHPGVPLVIFADQKGSYLDALEAADAGNFGPFLSFVEERAIDTIQMVRANMQTQSVPTIQARVDEFAPVLLGRGGLTHSEIDAIGVRIAKQLGDTLNQVVAENPLQEPFRISAGSNHTHKAPAGYRVAPGAQGTVVQVSIAGPGDVTIQTAMYVAISLPDSTGPDFVVHVANQPIVEASLREVQPYISRALEFRLKLAVEQQVSELLATAAAMSKRKLEKAGYRQVDE